MGQLTFTVPEEWAGRAAGDFLRREKGVSTRLLKQLKKLSPPEGICCNGEHIRTVDPVRAGDTVTLIWPEEERVEAALSCTAEVPVLYEDEWLVVFNKPFDMPSHPAKKHQTDTLGNVFAARMAKEGKSQPFRPVNRLDKDTTGIVVAAKDAYTASKLAGKVEKTYIALLCGALPQESGTVDAPIRRVDPVHILREVSADGRRAVTHYRQLQQKDGYTLARFRLETGRTHQIRAHMAFLGCPLAGDALYGGDSTVISRQALHCDWCSFVHPVSGETVGIKAEPDRSFLDAAEKLFGKDAW